MTDTDDELDRILADPGIYPPAHFSRRVMHAVQVDTTPDRPRRARLATVLRRTLGWSVFGIGASLGLAQTVTYCLGLWITTTAH